MPKSYLLLFAALGVASCSHEGVPIIAMEMDSLVVALQAHQAEFGALPSGTDSAICKALAGENARKLKFIEMRPSGIAADGRFLDLWGTPYRFYFSDGGIMVRSAGPNRQFDDQKTKHSDDYFRSDTKT